MNNLYIRALRSSVLSTLTLAACLFVPAWTLNYWQGWTYLAVFVVMTTWITIYFVIKNPALVERRTSAGPQAEKEASQRIIMSFAMIGFIALIVLPTLDHRLGWSPVSPAVAVIGDALVALGFLLFFLVLKQNSYAASTIEVAKEQKVVSTGLYGIVRHPMYAGVLPLLIGTPLALGSWWGLVALVSRLLDEERFLHKNLPGYTEYTQKVRWRLAPGIF
jgi:protein-S-isoprenylcysteine O-methyltransferase Ste14